MKFWLILLFAIPLSAFAQPHFFLPTFLKIGSIAEAYVWDDASDESVTIEVLSAAKGVLATAKTFPLPMDYSEKTRKPHLSAALLAVDALTKAGPGFLRVLSHDGKILKESRTELAPTKFNVEDIPLDREMTTLRANPNPVKDREAEEIWGIYKQFKANDFLTSGHFALPIRGEKRPSAFFGDTRHYLYSDGTSDWDYHKGTDFACPEGTSVFAPSKGLVVLAKERFLTGNTVVLEHFPGFYTVYFHMSKILIHTGDQVTLGTEIGLSGKTGLVTGPHLHWEARCNGFSVDALDLVIDGLLDKDRIAAILANTE